MKKDLLIVGILIVLVASSLGGVLWWQLMQPEDDGTTTIAPKAGPIAILPKKETPKKTPEPKQEPVRVASNPKKETSPPVKKIEPEPKEAPPPVEPAKKKEDEPPKKVEVKVEPKIEVKVEPKKPGKAKVIAIDNQIQLNDPDGEYTIETINRGRTVIVAGTVKTLKIAGLNEQSTLDARELDAREILFTGDVNSSKVLLGKAQTLTLRAVNNRSQIDGSLLSAKEIKLTGAINSGSSVKLHAPGGVVEILGDINDQGQIDVAAPEGKVLFLSQGASSINSGARLTVLARDVDLRGAVNGPNTRLEFTFTKDGTLKFQRLNGGVTLHYRSANASDAPPRVEEGAVDARAEFRKK